MSVMVTNRLNFSGVPERLAQIFEEIKSDKDGIGSLDYNKLIPMPEELNIECSSKADRGLAHYKNFVSDYMFSKGLKEIDYLNIPEEAELLHLKFYKHIPKDEWELGKKAYGNMIKYGARDWYYWSIEHWGVKWNAYQFKPPEERVENTIFFDSPTNAPHKVIKFLANKYPDVDITHEWACEKLGEYCGTKVYKEGKLIEEFEPETEIDKCNFAIHVYGLQSPEELGISINSDGTAYVRINIDDYDLIEIFDRKALFTNDKLYTADIPKGLYCYHLRHDDVGGINFVALEKYVCVNHGGTVITKEPIEFGESDYININEENYPNFLGEGNLSLQQFMNDDYELSETTEGMNMS